LGYVQELLLLPKHLRQQRLAKQIQVLFSRFHHQKYPYLQSLKNVR
jgi:hypothetical protein